QPRFSPDGSRILFTSDRGGGDNLWIMNADGTGRAPLTKEDFRLPNNGVWHPSGEWVAAKKHFTSTRSMGAGEMWMYHVPRGGGGIQLTKRKNDQMDVGEPCFGPEGRFLYWSEDMSRGSSFSYNKDPFKTIYVIRRLELATGEIRNLIDVAGGAVRPQVSPDGKSIAFVRRVGLRSVLSLFDPESGEIRALWDGLDEDQQETWSLFGVYPGYAWMPDGRALVIWAQGKLWRVDARSGEPENIPFHVDVSLSVADPVRFAPAAGGDTFPAKVIRWPRKTPGGDVVFQALGTLWKRAGNAATPKALFPASAAFRFAPNLSPDGKRMVYVTWNDRVGGTVRIASVDGKGERTVMARPGHYAWASFSPDGKTIVVRRGGGDRYRGYLWDEDPGIFLVDADGKGKPRFVRRDGAAPRFNRDGTRLFVRLSEEGKTILASFDLLGSDRRDHVSSERAGDIVLSPDERWVAFEELWQTYVAPIPLHAGAVEVAPAMKSLPVKRLSSTSGTYLDWSPDSRTVRWSLGPVLYEADVDSLYAAAREDSSEGGADADDGPRGAPARETALGWDAPADVPDTDLWITGATILPMDDLSRIDDGVVHVVGNRIIAVGPRGGLAPPEGAQVLDAAGKTLLPGFVDVHAHTGSANQGVYPQQNWAFLANLAFGVTTTHDPSNNTQMILGQSELVKAGTLLGPRVFSTGTILYGAEGDFKTVIDDYDDAREAVARQKAWGAWSVKSYNQPRRKQRQMVIAAGRELEMMVVPEGGSTLQNNLTHLIDGHTTLEHAIPVAPLYDPALRLLSRFGSGYTPTLIVGYGGLWGENYWYQHSDVWRHERLLTFVPKSVVEARARRRTMAPDEDYHHFALARTAAAVVHRGGNVEVGAHGQMQGIGVHWELWMLEQGGLTPHEALRCATWMGARALGLDGSLGSIREGRLADLILVEGDPTEDVRRSERVSHVMVNGRLYDARTLEQLVPDRRPLPAGPPKQAGSGGRNTTCLCERH
ncbi:amidohydrolase family protein, partial [bacterium]|nr:amidohydrolase family protein [bacterium]